MKKTIWLFMLILASLHTSITAKTVKVVTNSDTRKVANGIDDGWYKATVNYQNYNTGTNATYTLKVYVQYNTVIKIDFGNGGSIHSGYNNEGYVYRGGELDFETDYDGNLIAATTTVSTSDNDGLRYYKIRIE